MKSFRPTKKHAELVLGLPEEVRRALTAHSPGWAQVKEGEWRLLPSCLSPEEFMLKGWIPVDPTAIVALSPAKDGTGWEVGLDYEMDDKTLVPVYYACRTEISAWNQRKMNTSSIFSDDVWLAALQLLRKSFTS